MYFFIKTPTSFRCFTEKGWPRFCARSIARSYRAHSQTERGVLQKGHLTIGATWPDRLDTTKQRRSNDPTLRLALISIWLLCKWEMGNMQRKEAEAVVNKRNQKLTTKKKSRTSPYWDRESDENETLHFTTLIYPRDEWATTSAHHAAEPDPCLTPTLHFPASTTVKLNKHAMYEGVTHTNSLIQYMTIWCGVWWWWIWRDSHQGGVVIHLYPY